MINVKTQGDGYKVTYDNGDILSVPKADGNRHYEEVKQFIADGGIVEPEFTDEELLAKEQADFRATRDTELTAVDVLVYIAQDTDNGNVAELRRYRQALRQSTKTWVMPTREEYGVI